MRYILPCKYLPPFRNCLCSDAQWCSTLCNPLDSSPLESSVHVNCQALSMGFPRQEYWNSLPFSRPREYSQPRVQTHGHWVSYIAGQFFTTELREKPRSGISSLLIKLGEGCTNKVKM